MATLAPLRRSGGMVRSAARSLAARADWVLMGAVAAIAAFGLRMVSLTTRDDVAGDPGFYFTRQLTYTVVGIGVMAAAVAIDLGALARRMWALWGALIGAVAVVLVIGSTARGGTRWIDFGIFQFQPSEIGKIAMVVIIAALVADRRSEVGTLGFSALALGVTALPTFIVFIQPDLGTSLVYVAICGGMLFFAGVPLRQFAWAGGAAIVLTTLVLFVLPAVGLPVLKEYQVDRLTSFIDSSKDANDSAWQTRQARTAVGHGGALGTGADGATQVQNNLLPEHHTDFIFASSAEMWGFVGMTALILGFGILIWRGLRIATRASTLFDQLVAGGITVMLAFQVVVNIGMNVTILPITGIPLPFMSYGGSHTLTNFIAIGILLRIHRHSSRRIA